MQTEQLKQKEGIDMDEKTKAFLEAQPLRSARSERLLYVLNGQSVFLITEYHLSILDKCIGICYDKTIPSTGSETMMQNPIFLTYSDRMRCYA